jgi:hypothetical protein
MPALQVTATLEVAAVVVALWLSAALAVAGRRAALRALRRVPRSAWAIVLALTLLAAAVRLASPERYGIHGDEWWIMEQGRSALLRHRNALCWFHDMRDAPDIEEVLRAGDLDCPAPIHGEQPAGAPVAIALAYAAGGVSVRSAQAVSLASSVLAVPAMFLLAAAALGDIRAGVLAAALLALMPMHVLMALVPNADSLSALAATSALAALALALRTGSRSLAALAVLLLSLAASVRPENLVLAVPFAWWSRSSGPAGRRLRSPALWCLFAALYLPVLAHNAAPPPEGGLVLHLRPESGSAFSLSYLPRQAGSALAYLAPGAEPYWLRNLHTPVTAVAACIGVALVGRRRAAPLLLWSASLAGVYAFYYAFSPRFVLAASLGLVPLSGVGLSVLAASLFPEYGGAAPRDEDI